MRRASSAAGIVLLAAIAGAQDRRYVMIDQDAAGPGGTDMMSILVLLQSPAGETLGIPVAAGDSWGDEEVAHTLRLLEIVGRTDIPVVPGAAFPLVRTQQGTKLWEQQFGKVSYPFEVPPPKEGNPTGRSTRTPRTS